MAEPPQSGKKPAVPPGYRLIEGDILIPEQLQLSFVPAAGFGGTNTHLWPDGIVPYVFDSNVSDVNRANMREAMAEWEAVADVQFVLLSSQRHWIHIQDSDANSSLVGRATESGGQPVNIESWHAKFVLCHELGHALGFWHEQSRPDRNEFVRIEWDRIESAHKNNFELRDDCDTYGPYDFDSVMHYPGCAFSICSPCIDTAMACWTITVLPPWEAEWQTRIGQRDHLSYWDAMVMSFLYPRSTWRFVDSHSVVPGFGTFRIPFQQLMDGVASVPAGGTLWLLQPGTYEVPFILNKELVIRAPLGGAILDRTSGLGN